MTVALGVILAFVCLQWASSTEIIPERCQVDYFNEKYLTNVKAYIKRYARRSPYYANVEGTAMMTLDNNVSLHCVLYEYLHNEYKRSFVELHMNLCDLIEKNPWKQLLGSLLIARGAICPAPPGTYKFHNLTVSMAQLPYVVPFDKGMAKMYAVYEPTQDVIVSARFYAIAKH